MWSFIHHDYLSFCICFLLCTTHSNVSSYWLIFDIHVVILCRLLMLHKALLSWLVQHLNVPH
jgi:hypothetical protein